MFDTTTYLFKDASELGNRYGEEYRVSQSARQLYRLARLQGRIGQIVDALIGERSGRHLIALKDFAGQPASRTSHYAGLQTVPLNKIQGSVDRCNDFDAVFHPLKANTEQRWLRVATARQDGLGLPPVELIQVGDAYFVRDGHHRVSVARARGEVEIEAEVTTWVLA